MTSFIAHFLRSAITLIILLLFYNCCSQRQYSQNTTNCKQDTVGQLIYYNADTTSRLFVSHHECTECLDAQVDSGIVFLPDSVMRKIKDIYRKRGNEFIPNGHDLYLTGQNRITEIFFGDTSNYMEHWHDKYLIIGKAIDVKGLGIVFRVDSYKKLNNQ